MRPNSPDAIDVEKLNEIHSSYGTRISLALSKGHYAQAKAVLDAAVYELTVKPDLLPDRQLHEIGINVRTCNVLESQFGAFTVRDLVRVPMSELLRCQNVNVGTVDHLLTSLLRAIIKDDQQES